MSRGAGGKDGEEARAGKKRKVKVQDKPNQPQDFTDDFTAADLARSLHDLIDLIEAAEAAEETETTPTQPEPPNTDPAPPTHTAPQTHVQAHRATPRPATHAYTHAVIQADTRHQSGTSGGHYAGVMV